MTNFRILLIDDESAQITSIKAFLKRRKYIVYTASSGQEGLDILEKHLVDLVFSDYRMPGMSGLEVVKAIKEFNPNIPVIIVTAFSDTSDAVNVMKNGAYDYLSKPIKLDELELLVKKVQELSILKSENQFLKEQLKKKYKFDNIISQSGEMEEVINNAGRVAESKATVLIRGESGTGKELIARAVHQGSPRKEKPMITVNCAALSESLLESELFGHEKGSYTGAINQRIGRFEQANNGTLFIDEIGDISLQTQVKLLRVLQFGEFERVGGSKTIKTDVRVITATNRNLEEMISKGEFREDLFYRINVVALNIPSLKKRKSDIPILINHFISKYSAENNKIVTELSKEALETLMQYSFPGNIRELENIIERAVIMTRKNIITTSDLPPNLGVSIKNTIYDPSDFSNSITHKVSEFEKEMIENALEIKAGNQSQAAKLIGISERHLRSKMQKLQIINIKKLAK